jgi:hypothetical protein
LTGKTMSELGATPNEHFSIAPMQTCLAKAFSFWA